MAFIDTDEFLVMNSTRASKLPVLLAAFTEYASLKVYRRMIGSSGHIEPQPKVLSAYSNCFPVDNWNSRTVKAIVQPRDTLTAASPHHFHHRPHTVAVDTAGEVIHSALGAHPVYEVALYHYQTRSLSEFKDKMARGSGGEWRGDAFFHHALSDFQDVERQATDTCAALLDWWDTVGSNLQTP